MLRPLRVIPLEGFSSDGWLLEGVDRRRNEGWARSTGIEAESVPWSGWAKIELSGWRCFARSKVSIFREDQGKLLRRGVMVWGQLWRKIARVPKSKRTRGGQERGHHQPRPHQLLQPFFPSLPHLLSPTYHSQQSKCRFSREDRDFRSLPPPSNQLILTSFPSSLLPLISPSPSPPFSALEQPWTTSLDLGADLETRPSIPTRPTRSTKDRTGKPKRLDSKEATTAQLRLSSTPSEFLLSLSGLRSD